MKNKGDLMELFTLTRKKDWPGLFYMSTTNKWVQLFRYSFVGGGAFVVDFGTYCGLEYSGVPYLIAGIFSFFAGFIFNFLLSRWLIFRSDASKKISGQELFSVLIISLLGMVFTEILLFLGTDLLKVDFRASKIIASLIVLFWNYAARKIFVYKK